MCHVNNRQYAKDHAFSTDELAALTPEHVYHWTCTKAFGVPDPTAEDNPIHGRASSLSYYKKAISYFMPNKLMPWNAITKEGSVAADGTVLHSVPRPTVAPMENAVDGGFNDPGFRDALRVVLESQQQVEDASRRGGAPESSARRAIKVESVEQMDTSEKEEKMAEPPSREDLELKIAKMVLDVDLNTTNFKTFYALLSKELGGVDLASKKRFIKKTLSDIISSMERKDEGSGDA
jgi:hypothetical protein